MWPYSLHRPQQHASSKISPSLAWHHLPPSPSLSLLPHHLDYSHPSLSPRCPILRRYTGNWWADRRPPDSTEASSPPQWLPPSNSIHNGIGSSQPNCAWALPSEEPMQPPCPGRPLGQGTHPATPDSMLGSEPIGKVSGLLPSLGRARWSSRRQGALPSSRKRHKPQMSRVAHLANPCS